MKRYSFTAPLSTGTALGIANSARESARAASLDQRMCVTTVSDVERFTAAASPPRTIVHLITSLDGDGAQRVLLRLAPQLQKSGYRQIVVSMKQGGALAAEFRRRGIEIVELDMSGFIRALRGFAVLTRLLRQSRPAVVQAWMYHANLVAALAWLAAGRTGKLMWNIRRAYYNTRDDQLKRSTRWLVRAGARLSTLPHTIVYCGETIAVQHRSAGFDPRNGVVIENGFDALRFAPDPARRSALRKSLHLPEHSLLVGNIARFHGQKDHRTLLAAAEKVVSEIEHVYFLLIGRGVNSSNEWFVQNIPPAIRNRIILLGERDDVPDLIPGFDVFCSASTNEGFPNVVGEAMACGVPCVVTDAGASRDLVADTGAVVARGDPGSIAKALCELLKSSAEERSLLGSLARARVLSCYSMERCVLEYNHLYGQQARRG